MEQISSNKRIAKNTLFLYFRMMLIMVVALYSSRVVLDVLGASDYGLYNVVGGVVTMLAFINGALSSGTSRFIAYELGKGDEDKLNKIFNVSLVCHIAIAFVALIGGETIGLWFVNAKLQFPENRTLAVNVVYQLSILTCMMQFTQVPYTATIIAHERMNVYAYISIIEVALKLALIFFIKYVPTPDALIAYAILIFLTQLIVMSIYRFYCFRNFKESKWSFVRDKNQYKEIFSFSGWDVMGSLCVVTQGQGVNILLNMYFGPVVNAARAICYQVEAAFSQFTNNFITAVNPVIVKSYAVKDYDRMNNIVNNASLFSFYLLMVLMMPVMFRIDFLLNLWLKEVPSYTHGFILIVLNTTMIRALARPVINATHATGDIKSLNMYAGSIGLLVLPLAWSAIELFNNVYCVFWLILIFGCVANMLEITIYKQKMPIFSVMRHFRKVYIPAMLVSIMSIVIVDYFNSVIPNSFLGFCFYYMLSFISIIIVIGTIGINKNQRRIVFETIKNKIKK